MKCNASKLDTVKVGLEENILEEKKDLKINKPSFHLMELEKRNLIPDQAEENKQ